VPAGKRAALVVIEPQLVFQCLILLLDRPALMSQPDQARSEAVADNLTKYALTRGVVPRSRSKSTQTSGASRRARQSCAGVTRKAANCAAHGRWVPLRHVTRRHARAGREAAIFPTASGRVAPVSGAESVSPPGPVGVAARRPTVCRGRP
jgi:hypothetical protein